MIRIYLDNCCLNRPFDDFTVVRNRLESEAKLYIQSLVKYRSVALYYSFVTLAELDATPSEDRKKHILDFIQAHAAGIISSKRAYDIQRQTEKIMGTGLKEKDAMHLACAILAECDFFITTDRRIMSHSSDGIKVTNPIEFVQMWGELV